MSADEHGDRPPDLTADECVRAGTYWFGQGDFTAAEAWWRCAIQLDATHPRALECLRLLATAKPSPSGPSPSVIGPLPSPGGSSKASNPPSMSIAPDPYSGPDPFASPRAIMPMDPFTGSDPFATPLPAIAVHASSKPISVVAPTAPKVVPLVAPLTPVPVAEPDPYATTDPYGDQDPFAVPSSGSYPGVADDLASDILPVSGGAAPPPRSVSSSLETGSAREMREVSAFLDALAAESSQLAEVTDLSNLLDVVGPVTGALGPKEISEILAGNDTRETDVEEAMPPPRRVMSPSRAFPSSPPPAASDLSLDSSHSWTKPSGPGAASPPPRKSPNLDLSFDNAVWMQDSGPTAPTSPTHANPFAPEAPPPAKARADADPLEFATDIREETGDVIRMDDSDLAGNVSQTPWDDVPAIPDDDEEDDDVIRGDTSDDEGEAAEDLQSSDVIGMFDEVPDPAVVTGGDPEIQLDEAVEMPNTPLPTLDSPESLLQESRDRYQLHDFAGAIELAERLEAMIPGHAEARSMISQSRTHLMRMLESKVGSLEGVPRLLISSEEVIWLNLNHRAGFVLSQIDGALTYDDVIMLSGMPKLDALRIIVELIQNRVIGTE